MKKVEIKSKSGYFNVVISDDSSNAMQYMLAVEWHVENEIPFNVWKIDSDHYAFAIVNVVAASDLMTYINRNS